MSRSSRPGRGSRLYALGGYPLAFAVAVIVLGASPPLEAAALPQEETRAEEAEPAVEQVSPADAAAPKSTRMIGTARTGRRRWVTGATVLAEPESGAQRLYLTATDEKGTFRFEALPEGDYRVTLAKHGLATLVKDRVVLDYPFRAVVEVLMEPAAAVVPAAGVQQVSPPPAAGPASLEGEVLGRDGAGVGEVRVRAVRPDGTHDPHGAMTDTAGHFRFDDLAPGNWQLEVLGAGFLPMRVRTELAGDTEVTAVLVAQPAGYEPQPIDLMPPEEPIAPPPPPPREPETATTTNPTADDAASPPVVEREL